MLENLSVSGLMLRTSLPLEIGQDIGIACAFPWSAAIDLPVTIVSRVGDLYGARFRAGPLTETILADTVGEALQRGDASTASVHELGGCRVLRIVGGLNESLRGDLLHFIERVGVDEIDAAEVTAVDVATLAIFKSALQAGRLRLGSCSEVFSRALEG